jgi:hypothetical protein
MSVCRCGYERTRRAFRTTVAPHEESRVNERHVSDFQSPSQNGSGPCDFTPFVTLSFLHCMVTNKTPNHAGLRIRLTLVSGLVV